MHSIFAATARTVAGRHTLHLPKEKGPAQPPRRTSPTTRARTLPDQPPSAQAFAEAHQRFAQHGYELHQGRTAGRRIFVLNQFGSGRYFSDWHSVIGVLNALCDR